MRKLNRYISAIMLLSAIASQAATTAQNNKRYCPNVDNREVTLSSNKCNYVAKAQCPSGFTLKEDAFTTGDDLCKSSDGAYYSISCPEGETLTTATGSDICTLSSVPQTINCSTGTLYEATDVGSVNIGNNKRGDSPTYTCISAVEPELSGLAPTTTSGAYKVGKKISTSDTSKIKK